MSELIKLELKKLCRKRMTVIVTLCCFLATILFFSLPFIQYKAWDENGVMLSRGSAVSYKKACYDAISGVLTEERITQDMEEYQEIASDPDNLITERGGEISFTDGIYYGYLVPRQSYLKMIGNTYINNGMGASNITSVSLENGANFYEARDSAVKDLIEINTYLNETEKSYWLNKSLSVTSPYEYGYVLGWSFFGDTSQMLIICILGICISVAPVFSNEYQMGTDAIILSTRFGKSKLVAAKIISAILFGTVVFAVNAAVALLLPLMTFGADGGNLPLQIMDSTCPYELTFKEATFIMIGISYVIMLGITSFTLLLSAKMKSSYSVLIVDILIMFVPIFLGTGKTSFWSHVLFLLPYQALSGLSLFKQYFSYSIGNIVVNLITMIASGYLIVTVVAIPLAVVHFQKHQV